MDQLLVTKVDFKKSVILIKHLKNLFCQANCFNFFSSWNNFFVWHIKFGKREELKKELSEESMPVAWYPNRWWDQCMSEDEKKERDPMFIVEL